MIFHRDVRAEARLTLGEKGEDCMRIGGWLRRVRGGGEVVDLIPAAAVVLCCEDIPHHAQLHLRGLFGFQFELCEACLVSGAFSLKF